MPFLFSKGHLNVMDFFNSNDKEKRERWYNVYRNMRGRNMRGDGFEKSIQIWNGGKR